MLSIPYSFNSLQWCRCVNHWFSTLIAWINTPTQRCHARDNQVRWLRLRVISLQWVKRIGYLAILVAHLTSFSDVFSSNVPIRVCRDQQRLATKLPLVARAKLGSDFSAGDLQRSLFYTPLGRPETLATHDQKYATGITAFRSFLLYFQTLLIYPELVGEKWHPLSPHAISRWHPHSPHAIKI